LYKGPNESKHAHAPNVEAVAAEELTEPSLQNFRQYNQIWKNFSMLNPPFGIFATDTMKFGLA